MLRIEGAGGVRRVLCVVSAPGGPGYRPAQNNFPAKYEFRIVFLFGQN